jgi:hypothetical protein
MHIIEAKGERRKAKGERVEDRIFCLLPLAFRLICVDSVAE